MTEPVNNPTIAKVADHRHNGGQGFCARLGRFGCRACGCRHPVGI